MKASKDNRGLQPFCICKQFIVRALTTSTVVSLLIWLCVTAHCTLTYKSPSLCTVSHSLHVHFSSPGTVSNAFLYNPYPRYFAKKMQERTVGSKTTKQTKQAGAGRQEYFPKEDRWGKTGNPAANWNEALKVSYLSIGGNLPFQWSAFLVPSDEKLSPTPEFISSSE